MPSATASSEKASRFIPSTPLLLRAGGLVGAPPDDDDLVSPAVLCFHLDEVPWAEQAHDREVVGVPLQLNEHFYFLKVTVVSAGNPHCVVFTDRLDEDEINRPGPLIEHHPAFPNRTKVQFARMLGPRSAPDPDLGAGYRVHLVALKSGAPHQ